MLEREHDRGNAFDHEKRDENQGKREDATQWPQQQHDTDRNSEDRRNERPPETRRLAHPEGGDQADDSADEKEPAKQDLDRERSDGRNNDGGQIEDDKNDPSPRKSTQCSCGDVATARCSSPSMALRWAGAAMQEAAKEHRTLK